MKIWKISKEEHFKENVCFGLRIFKISQRTFLNREGYKGYVRMMTTKCKFAHFLCFDKDPTIPFERKKKDILKDTRVGELVANKGC